MDLLSIVAVLLIGGWALGFFAFGEAVGMLIHLLLVLAVIVVLVRIIKGKPVV
ncbi:lmo0937 family membrane protein [bacterium]|nr:lmo0937 family membrane protein [bacterium]NCQ54968.1 lmo0937 family membrane protein [Candidatus Parcubacteria bacterium]NCS67012.1 lmo0937 family membrane protein [Candidatus Peregrinibacteria bacterium]NCS95958.1 lmo0937 family membrane protein [bacterium]